MFNSKGREETVSIPAATSAVQPKRSVRSGAPSIISADLVVTGTIASTGDIQIDGRVDGDVHSTNLVIGDKAFVKGDVIGDDITIRGRVQGNIRARKVLLCSACHVEGNILHEALAMEAGAFFEGNCRHSDNPLAENAGNTQMPHAAPANTATASTTPAATNGAGLSKPADVRSQVAASLSSMKSSG